MKIQAIREVTYLPDTAILERLAVLRPNECARARITQRATELVETLRLQARPSFMESFLGEYGLSSEEGVALMCLAEALLRIPDNLTIDAFIADKIAPMEWGNHLGTSDSTMINFSTWGLLITGQVLRLPEKGLVHVLRNLLKRLGEPVIRGTIMHITKQMSRQFILAEDITGALKRAQSDEAQDYRYSYDMLGEAAMTEVDANAYYTAYKNAITAIAQNANSPLVRDNPGISIKLSALHPRYDPLHRHRVWEELVPKVLSLARLASSAGIGLNIDAEEASLLELSLDVIAQVLSDPHLAGWEGFGVVVQAYGKRAAWVIDWLYALAARLNRKIMVRLVKGAYWDTEIKLAQVEGLEGFPVFQTKAHTDINYICCAQKLFEKTDRIYPQFATHNAHTLAAILELAEMGGITEYEFQRLHGMGEALHDHILKKYGTNCRIYAPVGKRRDLLAYLVRRLLENSANSSFVHQVFDPAVSSSTVAADPFERQGETNTRIIMPKALFTDRDNSIGVDRTDSAVLNVIQGEITGKKFWNYGDGVEVKNPANNDIIGTVRFSDRAEAIEKASRVQPWNIPVAQRAKILRHAADLYQHHRAEIFQLLSQEAGKTVTDCIGEWREAIDFLRFYATEAEKNPGEPLGIFTCISPWNFPLAIFTGQIAAALATGNGVLAKPAEATSLIAHFAIDLMYQAGVPQESLILIAGTGQEVGQVLCSAPNVAGVCFTGSLATAQSIHRVMAEHLDPSAPLIAETGGINAMIVDSTALPEQVVQDVITSAFQSAGQRCSALRCLYIQEDIAPRISAMLFGAMDALTVSDPCDLAADVGPVIDARSAEMINKYIAQKEVLHQVQAPQKGHFVAPTVLKVGNIHDVQQEIFGPVLHLATYRRQELEQVIHDINATGYGLTFGLHSRIAERIEYLVNNIHVGNVYINRNQIGAVVGSQPFGGCGFSGTGPKAGGLLYLSQFMSDPVVSWSGEHIMQGPTGECNHYHITPKSDVYTYGVHAEEDAEWARGLGIHAKVFQGRMEDIATLEQLDLVIGSGENISALGKLLAERSGAIVQLRSRATAAPIMFEEKTICTDTTAAGGNVALLKS